MKHITYSIALALTVVGFAAAAHAQTATRTVVSSTNNGTVMTTYYSDGTYSTTPISNQNGSYSSYSSNGYPIFYNQNGTALNTSGTNLTQGWYYMNGQQVYNYGNGTWYNPTTGTYGGQSVTTVNGQIVSTPGVPNTGGTTYLSTGGTVNTSVGSHKVYPVFYNSSGSSVNPYGNNVTAGWYYMDGQLVYYYGNGVWYNPTTAQYYGDTGNINTGSLTIPTTPTIMTPGLPNTGGSIIVSSNQNSTMMGSLNRAGWGLLDGAQVYFYGDGTWYDPSTGLYGGHSYTNPGGSYTTPTTPSYPNTGAGGNSPTNWAILIVAALVAAGSAAYTGTRARMR